MIQKKFNLRMSIIFLIIVITTITLILINSDWLFKIEKKAQLITSLIVIIANIITITILLIQKLMYKNYETMLTSIINNLPGITYRSKNNQNRTILFINNGVQNIFGYSANDFYENKKINLYNIILEEDRDTVCSVLTKAIEYNTNFEIIYRIKDSNNDIKWVMERGNYSTSSNQIEGFITDITELKSKENQLIQAQKMETIGTLASGLAHDFNNVIGGITGTLSLLKFKLKKNSDLGNEKILPFLDTIEDSSMKAADLVKQLLSLSRKEETNITTIDLNTSIKHIVKICENSFDKSIEIFSSKFENSAYINADMSQIEQALLNLAINSSHAMTSMRPASEVQGGVLSITTQKITADKYFKSIHPDAKSEKYYVISITDTGIGIEDKNINKIFDPFYSTKDSSEGTGLGLTMVYNIIESHKGFIEVHSKKNISTTFQIFLPAIDESEIKKISSTIEDVTVPTGEGVILVVDDEQLMRQTASAILEECGYQVLLANNGQEAIDLYNANQDVIDLILLDMVMPIKSGKDALYEIRQIDSNVKIVMTSGFKLDRNATIVGEKGANFFVQKPYTLFKLATIIDDLLNKGK